MQHKRGLRPGCAWTLRCLSSLWKKKKLEFKRKEGIRVVVNTVGVLMRIIAFQGDFLHNEQRLPGMVYNFLLVVTIFPKYVSGCWPKVWRPRQVDKRHSSEKASYFLQCRESSAVTERVYIAVVNEIFIVVLGARWMVCWTMLLATSYKPEGRSLPPSHWDNTFLSDLCWDEVCVPEKGGGRESNPHWAILQQPLTGRPQRWRPDRKRHTGWRFVLQRSDSVHPLSRCERKQLQGTAPQILTSALTRLFDVVWQHASSLQLTCQ